MNACLKCQQGLHARQPQCDLAVVLLEDLSNRDQDVIKTRDHRDRSKAKSEYIADKTEQMATFLYQFNFT